MAFLLLGASQVSGQILINAPEPAGNPNFGGTPSSGEWPRICAGISGFNQYFATVSWVGTPNGDNEWILELSDASGNFGSPTELARESSNTAVQNPGFEFSIPSDTRGTGYKMRVRSTSPATTGDESPAYDMYFMDFTTTIHISPNGDGTTPGTVCSTTPITLSVDNIPNANTYQYIWNRSGTPLSETGPNILADQDGTYQVELDYGSCTGSSSAFSNGVTITIGGSGQGIAIDPPTKTALCTGETETLSINITNAAWSYQWYKDDAAISGATAATYIVDANTVGFEGDYAVEISATGICTERSAAITMTNAANFTATRNNPANVVVLPSQPETLSVGTTAISPSYQWYRNGGSIPGATNSTLDITQDGSYYVAVTQNGGACSSTINSEATTAVVPASFEVTIDYASNYTACTNTSMVLEVSTINALDSGGTRTDVTSALVDAFGYQWKKDGANVVGETAKNISLTSTTENGSYLVDATLNTYNEASSALPVILLTNETVAISSTSTVYCNSSDTITLSTTTDLSGESFAWHRDGSPVNSTDAALNVSQPGTYRLVLDKNGCELNSNEVTISPLDANLIQLDVDGDVIFPEGSSKTVTASGGTAYQWFDADNNLLGNSNSMTFTEEGSYLLIANIDNCEISRPVNAVYLDLFNVPNVITPNGDGANDQWVVPNSYSNKQDINVVIYNDKGVEVVNVMGYQNNWPESSMTFPKQNMVFYYVIKNTSETLKQGTITVIR